MARKLRFGGTFLLGLTFLVPGMASCQADEPSHTFKVDPTEFRLEEGLPLSFTNAAEDPVGVVFLCFTWLQGLQKETWVDLFEPDCSNIRVFPVLVQPGETYEEIFPLEGIDPDTLAGWEAFRLRSALRRRGQPDEEILSDPFALPLD